MATNEEVGFKVQISPAYWVPCLLPLVAALTSNVLAAESNATAVSTPDKLPLAAEVISPSAAASGITEEEPKAAPSTTDAAEVVGNRPALAPEIQRAAFGPTENALAQRVEERWQAMVEKDFDKVYGYNLPSYRQTNTLEQFKGRFGKAVTWREAEVQGIQYNGPESARVRINLEVEYVPSWGGAAQPAITRVDEIWLNRDGTWWISLSK
jgi:hypothetical protein